MLRLDLVPQSENVLSFPRYVGIPFKPLADCRSCFCKRCLSPRSPKYPGLNLILTKGEPSSNALTVRA